MRLSTATTTRSTRQGRRWWPEQVTDNAGDGYDASTPRRWAARFPRVGGTDPEIYVSWSTADPGDRSPTTPRTKFTTFRVGQRIAYTLQRHRLRDLRGHPTAAAATVADDPIDDFDPSFSPSGRRIAYYSDAAVSQEIFTVRANGGGRRQVTDNMTTDWQPSYSPSGNYIAF